MNKCFCSLTKSFAVSIVGGLLAQSASAATVSLSATDAAGTSSFASGLHWSDTTAPSAANDYTVASAFSLRTVADSGSATFAGNSLTLGNGTTAGLLVFKNQASGAVVTVNNLTLNNGTLQDGGTSSGAGSIVTFASNGVTLTAATTNRIDSGANDRTLIVTAPITGSGILSKVTAGTGVLTGANDYSGGTTILAGMLQFAKTASMPASGTVSAATGGTLGVNVGGVGEFTAATSGNGSIGGLLSETAGGQGAPVTLAAGSSLGIDTTNATGTVTYTGAFTSANSVGLLKLGTGTLELQNGGTYAGGGGAGFPLVVRQGILLLNGGTHTVTGEAVVGGVFGTSNGATGLDAKLQVDSGSLSISGYLSVGRGNGIGVASSDFVLNNSATATAANISAGYNGGNGSNLPKGSLTLNNSSILTISGDGVFNLAESAGSNMSMTLNGSSQFIANGTGLKYIGQGGTGTLTLNGTSSFTTGNSLMYVGYQAGTGILNVAGGTLTHAGELRVGGSTTNGTAPNGTGTVSISSGTVSVGALTVARGNNNQNTVSGSVTVSGGTLNSAGDVLLGFAGNNNLGKLTVSGGTVNVGTSGAKWLILSQYDTSKGQVDVTSGALNLYNNSEIHFTTGNTSTVSTNVINQSGGAVTFYSDNGTTVGGTGFLDLQTSGAAGVINSYNLDGGTLTVPRIASTLTTGTRTFNFNGGTLKAAVASATFMNLGTGTGTARANVRNGGAIIDSNGVDVTIAQPLLHSNIGGDAATDGGLTKQGTGTLTLSGASTYTGATTINAGTLALANTGSLTSSAYNLGLGATFDVSALGSYSLSGKAITFSLNDTTNGFLNAGSLAITLGGSVTLNLTTGTLAAAYNLYDSGIPTGNLDTVMLSGSFSGSLIQSGDIWSGTSGGYNFSLDQTSGLLSVTAVPEPSEYALMITGLLAILILVRRRKTLA